MTYLSSDALREARKFMSADQKGVRDEIGFLLIHQKYADRFFPGTSVLHTRIRYILFVPWMYHDEHARPSRRLRVADSIKAREYTLTGRLLDEPFGVIGSGKHPDPVEQRPSQVYWTALRKWGILRDHEDLGSFSRGQVERLLSAQRTARMTDDEGISLAKGEWPFLCDDPPDEWRGNGKLTFRLLRKEKIFLARQIRGLKSDGLIGAPSLFAQLVGHDLANVGHAWNIQIQRLAGKERPALVRAGHVAALAAIGRAIYAAQVETLRARRDRTPTSDRQRKALAGVVSQWRDRAALLDWDAFSADMKDLPEPVAEALRSTLQWVRRGSANAMALEDAYRAAEQFRKGRRSRLSLTQDGVERRMEWDNEAHPKAEPLHYRWDRVKMLLADLVGA
jgi:hypothetical protein